MAIRILTDYYKLEMLKQTKSNRFDCICSTGEYGPFESIAAKSKTNPKRFYCYLLDKAPNTFSPKVRGAAGPRITCTDNISRIVMPDLQKQPFTGYGDTKGTTDALLFQFSKDCRTMEIFIARGRKINAEQLYYLFADGELDDEILLLRERSKDVLTPTPNGGL